MLFLMALMNGTKFRCLQRGNHFQRLRCQKVEIYVLSRLTGYEVVGLRRVLDGVKMTSQIIRRVLVDNPDVN